MKALMTRMTNASRNIFIADFFEESLCKTRGTVLLSFYLKVF